MVGGQDKAEQGRLETPLSKQTNGRVQYKAEAKICRAMGSDKAGVRKSSVAIIEIIKRLARQGGSKKSSVIIIKTTKWLAGRTKRNKDVLRRHYRNKRMVGYNIKRKQKFAARWVRRKRE